MAVTVNEPAVPTTKLVLFGLVIAGALDPCRTVSVKFCVASVADAVVRGEGDGVGASGTGRGCPARVCRWKC